MDACVCMCLYVFVSDCVCMCFVCVCVYLFVRYSVVRFLRLTSNKCAYFDSKLVLLAVQRDIR